MNLPCSIVFVLGTPRCYVYHFTLVLAAVQSYFCFVKLALGFRWQMKCLQCSFNELASVVICSSGTTKTAWHREGQPGTLALSFLNCYIKQTIGNNFTRSRYRLCTWYCVVLLKLYLPLGKSTCVSDFTIIHIRNKTTKKISRKKSHNKKVVHIHCPLNSLYHQRRNKVHKSLCKILIGQQFKCPCLSEGPQGSHYHPRGVPGCQTDSTSLGLPSRPTYTCSEGSWWLS